MVRRTSAKAFLLLLAFAAVPVPGSFAHAQEEESEQAAPSIDAATGKVLNEAIEALNAESYDAAREAISRLNLERLSPYERSRVEQILASIDYNQEDYTSAQEHLREAINAGGLNELELTEVRYQIAQMYMAAQSWAEGAAALEEWLATAQKPNSAAYYLLAVAYYQLEDYERALPPAQKAVELTVNPQESWLQLVLALRLQRDQYAEAVPLLEKLIAQKPDNKTYWLQLSSVYGQLEDYPRALAVVQAAYSGGLVTAEEDIRRLADLLLMNGIPYRAARVLETAIAADTVKADSRTLEKLADCWIASGEYTKAIVPLERAAKLADDGDLFVRLGQVHIQREEWPAAAKALEQGINKGDLSDTGNAELMMGVALLNQQKTGEARDWFQRASRSPNQRRTARSYLQVIEAQTRRS